MKASGTLSNIRKSLSQAAFVIVTALYTLGSPLFMLGECVDENHRVKSHGAGTTGSSLLEASIGRGGTHLGIQGGILW